MSQVVIENPIINSPFKEPTRYFRFSDEGITNDVVEGRRINSYFIPIAKPENKFLVDAQGVELNCKELPIA